MNCQRGALIIYDGPDDESPVLASLCGHRFPLTLHSSSKYVYMKLSDVTWPEDSGYRITVSYEVISKFSIHYFI